MNCENRLDQPYIFRRFGDDIEGLHILPLSLCENPEDGLFRTKCFPVMSRVNALWRALTRNSRSIIYLELQ